jgi:F-type H+-transporting ATPase subunit delta
VAEDLKAADVGARYAKALFDLATETGSVAAVEADLRALKQMRAESAELRTLMASPVFTAEDKGKALVALAVAAKFDMTTAKLLGLMASNRRASDIGSAINSFLALASAARGAIAAEVTSAVPLTAAQQKALKASLAQSLGRDPELETRVDPSILGGLKVRVGSRLYDASLRSKLDSLRFALKRA